MQGWSAVSSDRAADNRRARRHAVHNVMPAGECVHRSTLMYVCMRAFVTRRSYSLSSHECAPLSQTEKMCPHSTSFLVLQFHRRFEGLLLQLLLLLQPHSS